MKNEKGPLVHSWAQSEEKKRQKKRIKTKQGATAKRRRPQVTFSLEWKCHSAQEMPALQHQPLRSCARFKS